VSYVPHTKNNVYVRYILHLTYTGRSHKVLPSCRTAKKLFPCKGAGNVRPHPKCLDTGKQFEETEVINLYINQRRIEAVTIIDLKGRERFRGVTVELHKSIRCLADEGKIQVLLDLAWVKHIDSIGLGELISSRVTLEDKGGSLKLMHMSESVHELMTITKLSKVFDVYDDEPEALASFAGESLRIVERQPFFM
jgi:anti-sigma B factor antagonist